MTPHGVYHVTIHRTHDPHGRSFPFRPCSSINEALNIISNISNLPPIIPQPFKLSWSSSLIRSFGNFSSWQDKITNLGVLAVVFKSLGIISINAWKSFFIFHILPLNRPNAGGSNISPSYVFPLLISLFKNVVQLSTIHRTRLSLLSTPDSATFCRAHCIAALEASRCVTLTFVADLRAAIVLPPVR